MCNCSKKKRGYLLAILGGSFGGPFGWITSPLVLYVLNKKVKSKDGKQPNIFKIWSLVGLIGAPLSWGLAYLLLVVPEKKFDYLCQTYEDISTEIETGRKLEMQSFRNYGNPKFTYYPDKAVVKQETMRKGKYIKLDFPISKDGSFITWKVDNITRTFNLSNKILSEKFISPEYKTNMKGELILIEEYWENIWKARCSLKD